MSKGKVLVTDSLFIFDEHVETIENAGYEVVRVEKPDISEAELIEAVRGKVGYILGGVEYVTDEVIDAAQDLKAVVFTGTGFKGHIPGWRHALENGVMIGNTPYANVYEVAEWALAATLAMQRNLFDLGPQGTAKFHTVKSLPDLQVGVVGLGHIGKQYADMIAAIGAKEVLYWSRGTRETGYTFAEKERLFSQCDIIFVAVSDEAQNCVTRAELDLMKKDSLLVSIAHHGIINEQDLYQAVHSGRIRAALDIVKDKDKFRSLPPSRWYASNASAAYNSERFLKKCSDMAVETLLNLLETGHDKNKVIE